MANSKRLSLPYLLPSQAQKHVTHNEALQQLDILVQMAIEWFDADSPPALPAESGIWALGAAPTGAWAGHADELAAWVEGTWLFIVPQEGWQALDKSSGGLKYRSATGWEDLAPPDLSDLSGVGINTGWNSSNRLAVAAHATLLSHEGAGHQLKLNKATATDTASLLFQTGFLGRAEMGTAGGDDFAIKLSPDGSAWTTALQFDAISGIASGAAVQANATDITPGRLARADHAFGPGNLLGTVNQSGGLPTGAVIENGSNANGSYVRFADGTQICWASNIDMGSILAGGAGTWSAPYRTNYVTLTWPVAFVGLPAATLSFGPDTGTVPVDARGLTLNAYEAPDASGWNFIRAARIGDSAYDVNILLSVQAIGRWF